MDFKRLEFFKNKDISKLDENLTSVILNDDNFLYKLSPLDDEKLALKDYRIKENEKLKEIDSNYKNDIFIEKFEDTSYLIEIRPQDYKNFLSDDEIIEVGRRIGDFIRNFHDDKVYDKALWHKLINNRINLLTYTYNMSPFKSERAYIIFDFLDKNKYILEDRKVTRILNFKSLDNIAIGKDLSFFIDSKNMTSFTDSFYEFRSFNKDFDKLLLKYSILQGYFKGKIPRLFYRILAIYTIEDIISSKYSIDANADIHEDLDRILDIYDNFESIKPRWIRNLEERLAF